MTSDNGSGNGQSDELTWGDVDPIAKAARHAAPALPKRFYKSVEAPKTEGGFALALDGRTARTPGKKPLIVPTIALASAITLEWDAQKESINPETMPVTRAANSTLDGVIGREQAVLDEIVRYANSDMICYRANAPRELVARQVEAWQPIEDFVETQFTCRPMLIDSITHADQPEALLKAISASLSGANGFVLSGLYTLTALTGSAFIALALRYGKLSPDDAWAIAHVDEDWQIEQWGEDEEAMERRVARRAEFDAAILFLDRPV